MKYYVPSTWKRLIAKLIDFFVVSVFISAFEWKSLFDSYNQGGVSIHILDALLIICFILFYEVLGYVIWGATPGKLLFQLKMIPSHHPEMSLTWSSVFLRVLTSHLSFFFGLSLYALAFFKYDRTHLADWVAGTRIVSLVPRRGRVKLRPFLGTGFIFLFLLHSLQNASVFLGEVHFNTSNYHIEIKEEEIESHHETFKFDFEDDESVGESDTDDGG